jgi:fimbrial isopeptide formation D2 family protein/uncharacterized repeat protein (TIGR01451 family)
MKRLPFRRGVVLVLALAVLAAVALWLGVFGQERAAAAADDLTVTVASTPVSGTTMASGSVISYVVTVTADAAIDVADDNITLEIDLANATFVAGTLVVSAGIICDTSGLPIDCDIPEFAAAGSKTVSFDARVGATGPVLAGAAIDLPVDGADVGEFDEGTGGGDFAEDEGDDETLNCAAVGEGTDGGDATEPDNFDCTSHDVANAELTITKVASPAETTEVATGGTITYTLTVSNSALAAGTATDVLIRDYIGTGLTFVSATPGSGVTCGDTIPPQIECTVDSIAPGQTRAVAIAVTVAQASGAVLNGARVDPNNIIGEDIDDADDPDLTCTAVGEGSDTAPANEPDNYDCTSHTVAALPDLTITKTASPAETTAIDTGDTITYTVTVSNPATAASTATNVAIRDTIGLGLTLSSVTAGTGVTCSDTVAPEINCTAASIAPGENRTVTIAVTVAASSGSVLNGAYVDPANAIPEVNDDADDPSLACGDVGEGTDTGDATEPDNFDCTSHSFAGASPTPTAGEMVNCPFSGKWAMSVWDGPNDTATVIALATCTGVTIQAAYALDRTTNLWTHYFPGRTDINTLLTLDDMQAIFTLGQ